MIFLLGAIAFIILLFVIDFLSGGKLINAFHARAVKASQDAAKAVSDPAAEANLAISQAKAGLSQAKQKLNQLKEDRAVTARKLDVASNNADRYEQVARLAGSSGKADDVRKALTEKKRFVAEMDLYKNKLEQTDKVIADFSATISKRELEIEAADRNKQLSILKIETNETLTRFEDDMASLKNSLGSDLTVGALEEAALRSETARKNKEGENDSSSAGLLARYENDDAGVDDDELNRYLQPAPANDNGQTVAPPVE